MINLIMAALVLGYLLLATFQGDDPPSTISFTLALVAIAAWACAILLPSRMRRTQRVVLLVMVVAAASTVWGTSGLMIAPVIAGLIQIVGWEQSAAVGYLAAALAAVIIGIAGIGAVTADDLALPSLLAVEAGVAIALLVGSNRRQARARDAAAREAEVQAAMAHEEQAKASALAVRHGLARDMHDVLAHSLGGLVIQLDAAEAQLESGQTDAALARLHDAREMAAIGLADARRAVDALRADPAAGSVSGEQLVASIVDLVEAHRRLGGDVELAPHGEPRPLSADAAAALRRVTQESLSNARKHAPGTPVAIRLSWSAHRVELTIRNPLARTVTPTSAALAESGAGHGLVGIRERFAALPGGEATMGEVDGGFEVRVSAQVEDEE
ncbi:MAG: histidine kinase [Microbacterium sp.]